MHKLQELVRLHRMGTRAREVARLLRMSPNTERFWRRAFLDAGLLDGPIDDLPDIEVLEAVVPAKKPPQQLSSVEELTERVEGFRLKGVGPRAIYDRLRLEDPDFPGSYYAIKRLWSRFQRQAAPSVRDVVIPVETLPGQVAQVDFGYAGYLVDPATGQQRRAWVFVMVLGHSRHLFARIVFNQTAATWQQLHVEAFAYFGGVPEVIVPDNLKSAVVNAAFGLSEDPALNRSYCEVARHYGFKIDPTPPASPEKKGKVERAVRYVKRNAIATLPEQLDVVGANRELKRWALEIAGLRIHGTMRRKPLEVFESEERAALKPLPRRPFVPVTWKQARVYRDCHIIFDKSMYSVPWAYMGKRVWVRATPQHVTVYSDDKRVAEHDRRSQGGRSTIDDHLPSNRRDFRHRGRAWWESQARAIGPETGALITEIFDDAEILFPIRKVQGIVKHLERFPRDRAEGSSAQGAALPRPCVRRHQGHPGQGARSGAFARSTSDPAGRRPVVSVHPSGPRDAWPAPGGEPWGQLTNWCRSSRS